MPIIEDSVYAALRGVIDPELFVNIVDLGLIYEVKISPAGDKSNIHVLMTMTSPACPAGPELVRDSREAIEDLGEEVGEVTVEVTLSPPWTPDRMSEDARDELGMYY